MPPNLLQVGKKHQYKFIFERLIKGYKHVSNVFPNNLTTIYNLVILSNISKQKDRYLPKNNQILSSCT